MKKHSILLKISALFVILALMTVSCEEKKNDFTVTVYVADKYNGNTAYFFDPLQENGKALDSVRIENSSFSVTGPIPTQPFIRMAKFGDDIMPAVFVCEKGNIEIVYNQESNRPAVKGSPLNDSYQAYTDSSYALLVQLQQLYDGRNKMEYKSDLSPEQKFNQRAAEENVKNKLEELACEYIKANYNNPLGKLAFYTEDMYISPAKQLGLLSFFDDGFRQTEQFKQKEKILKSQLETAVGSRYIDIRGTNIQGKPVSLSDYVGKKKYVILDFWASWSTPCEATVPHLASLYDEFRSKGLEIVSVSLDTEPEKWMSAAKALGICWPQLSNLQGFNDAAALAYGINDVPELLIIDRNGTIIARGIRGGELQDKIDELMDYKIPPSPIG